MARGTHISARAAFSYPRVVVALLLLGVCLAELVSLSRHTVTFAVFVVAAIALLLLVALQLMITSRALQIARAELADEHRRLESLFVDAPIGMALVDGDWRYVQVNPALCAMLGRGESELVGRPVRDFFHPDEWTHEPPDVGPEGTLRVRELERRILAGDGSLRWASVAISDVAAALPGARSFVIQARDITKRKHAEQSLLDSEKRWRTLLAHSQEIVTLVDREGRITLASPAVQRWLGYAPEQLTGRRAADAGHPDDRPALAAAFREVTADHPAFIAHRVRHRDGSWRNLESTFVSLRDDPVIDALLVTSRDVTERVALERERERLELERRVSQRLEAVGQLASGIAHEINTPMQYVSDSVEFLKDAVEDLLTITGLYRGMLQADDPLEHAERRRRAAEAEAAAQLDYVCTRVPAAFERTLEGISRVTSIVQAMKRFSHPSASEMSPADLGEAIDTTLAVCRNEYKYVADVVRRLAPLPPVVCNVGEINQVLLNLIVNAAQAIEEKVTGTERRGTITIDTAVDAGEAVITVADDGVGIPPELMDRIYEPFFTTKEVGRGSGQGLALARTTVEQHGGSLQCSSMPGVGTTFMVRLPLRPPVDRLADAA